MWQPGLFFFGGPGPSFSGRRGDSGPKQRGDFQRDSLWQLCGIFLLGGHDLILPAVVTVRIREIEVRRGHAKVFAQGEVCRRDAACWTFYGPSGGFNPGHKNRSSLSLFEGLT